jgi:hypothetical protein
VQFPASRRKTLFGETPNTTRGDAYAPQPRASAIWKFLSAFALERKNA